jgi:hypothetical protein
MTRFSPLARWPSETLRWWLRGLLASLVLACAPGYAADAPTLGVGNFPGTLTLREKTLAARVAAVPLRQVMAELSRLSGAQVRWLTPGGEEPVSVDFPARPLAEALERLLGEQNFLLFYTEAGAGMRLTRIWISARETSQERPPAHGSEPAGTPPPPPVRQPLPSRQGDYRSSQTAMDAQGPLARSGISTQSQRGPQEDPPLNLIPSQEAHSESSPQGQAAAVATRLLGGTAPAAAGVPAQCLPNATATHFADVMGDGRADAIAINGRGITVRPSDGRHFLFSQAWTAGAYYGTGGTYFADVTGDGRVDAIAVDSETITIRRASIAGFVVNEAWTTEPYAGSRGTYFADVTGDGRADAIAVTDTAITVRRSDGGRFLANEAWTTEPYAGSRGTYFADVTGDGRADAIAVNTDKIIVRPSTGAGFFSPQAWTLDPYYGDLSPLCTN